MSSYRSGYTPDYSELYDDDALAEAHDEAPCAKLYTPEELYDDDALAEAHDKTPCARTYTLEELYSDEPLEEDREDKPSQVCLSATADTNLISQLEVIATALKTEGKSNPLADSDKVELARKGIRPTTRTGSETAAIKSAHTDIPPVMMAPEEPPETATSDRRDSLSSLDSHGSKGSRASGASGRSGTTAGSSASSIPSSADSASVVSIHSERSSVADAVRSRRHSVLPSERVLRQSDMHMRDTSMDTDTNEAAKFEAEQRRKFEENRTAARESFVLRSVVSALSTHTLPEDKRPAAADAETLASAPLLG